MDTLPCVTNGKLRSDDDITRAKNGDKAAFARLIEANATSLYRVGVSILQNDSDAEDACQEAIIKAYNAIVYLKHNEYFKTWLIKIMINECNLILRNRKRTVTLGEASGSDPRTTDSYERLELWEIVKSLEGELREIVILYFYEDMKQNEIATVLNIPCGTVKSRISRAKEKLRSLLDIKLR